MIECFIYHINMLDFTVALLVALTVVVPLQGFWWKHSKKHGYSGALGPYYGGGAGFVSERSSGAGFGASYPGGVGMVDDFYVGNGYGGGMSGAGGSGGYYMAGDRAGFGGSYPGGVGIMGDWHVGGGYVGGASVFIGGYSGIFGDGFTGGFPFTKGPRCPNGVMPMCRHHCLRNEFDIGKCWPSPPYPKKWRFCCKAKNPFGK